MTSKKVPFLTRTPLFMMSLLRPRILGKYALIVALVALAACNNGDPVLANKGDPLAVVRASDDAFRRKDLAAYVATLDPESPNFQQSKELFAQLIQNYELRSTVKDYTLESMSDDEARVRFDIVTEKVSGPYFRDNHSTGVITLRKRNGEWKLFNTQFTNIEYLDK